uniref:Uncharacterized protein n=1 Tax=Octactis speculum TaxID=3111310 RepID=A0A7S2BP19_9STRA|mmetsp:Transcript_25299/g.34704  ORF Transcript_25299/g.34704 Transcript_25299/m.34704 type:complete len:114 (+) Transcript_25299:502-843(+)
MGLEGTLAPLASCLSLEILELRYCQQLTGGLDPLTSCRFLETLSLAGCKKLTGTLAALASCASLDTLLIYNSGIRGSLEHLRLCPLVSLNVRLCAITGVDEFKRSHPGCSVSA